MAIDFEQKWNEVESDLNKVAWSRLRNRADVDFVMSTVRLKAWKGLRTYVEEHSKSFFFWNLAILRHEIYNFKHNNWKKRVKLCGEIIYQQKQAIKPQFYEEPFCDEIQAGLDSVPETRKKAMLLCDVEGYKYKEIADILHIPMGTVMSGIKRARDQMRNYVQDRKDNVCA